MAPLGEVPFGRYYGSVDATPLFVMLAGAYYERTGRSRVHGAIWPHVERALDWIDELRRPATATASSSMRAARRTA